MSSFSEPRFGVGTIVSRCCLGEFAADFCLVVEIYISCNISCKAVTEFVPQSSTALAASPPYRSLVQLVHLFLYMALARSSAGEFMIFIC